MTILGAWPLSSWDDEDQVFFSLNDPHADSCGLRLSIDRNEMVDGKHVEVRAQCMVYALDWAVLCPGWSQFSVSDSGTFTSAMNEIQLPMPVHADNSRTLLGSMELSPNPLKVLSDYCRPKHEAGTCHGHYHRAS